jgi:hypothetical protein
MFGADSRSLNLQFFLNFVFLIHIAFHENLSANRYQGLFLQRG